jgi:uncharacterized Zn finger protein
MKLFRVHLDYGGGTAYETTVEAENASAAVSAAQQRSEYHETYLVGLTVQEIKSRVFRVRVYLESTDYVLTVPGIDTTDALRRATAIASNGKMVYGVKVEVEA